MIEIKRGVAAQASALMTEHNVRMLCKCTSSFMEPSGVPMLSLVPVALAGVAQVQGRRAPRGQREGRRQKLHSSSPAAARRRDAPPLQQPPQRRGRHSAASAASGAAAATAADACPRLAMVQVSVVQGQGNVPLHAHSTSCGEKCGMWGGKASAMVDVVR